jgi:hypothetical protein
MPRANSPRHSDRGRFRKENRARDPVQRGLMNSLGLHGPQVLSQVVVIQNLAPVVRRLKREGAETAGAYPLRSSRHVCMMIII